MANSLDEEDEELLGTELRSMEDMEDELPAVVPKANAGKAGVMSCLLAPSSLLLALAVDALAVVVLMGLAADSVLPGAHW